MPAKRSNGKTAMEEVMSGATERVLKQITELYDSGLGGGPGSIGLKVGHGQVFGIAGYRR
jgi:hypothetical protein